LSSNARVPVIVGVGQVTETTLLPEAALSPKGLMLAAARAAAADCGAGEALLRSLDSLVVIRLFSDTVPSLRSPFGTMQNPPWSVAQALGATPREMGLPRLSGHL
jgi:acetyl-CoA C-acetyltransferase